MSPTIRQVLSLMSASLLALMFAGGACAQATKGRLASPLSPNQNLMIENTRLTTAEFWEAYTSQATEERRRAELFLIGVLDATEGIAWCDYARFKTITIDEVLYGELRKLAPEKRNDRAARTIAQTLARTFPCGRKH